MGTLETSRMLKLVSTNLENAAIKAQLWYEPLSILVLHNQPVGRRRGRQVDAGSSRMGRVEDVLRPEADQSHRSPGEGAHPRGAQRTDRQRPRNQQGTRR